MLAVMEINWWNNEVQGQVLHMKKRVHIYAELLGAGHQTCGAGMRKYKYEMLYGLSSLSCLSCPLGKGRNMIHDFTCWVCGNRDSTVRGSSTPAGRGGCRRRRSTDRKTDSRELISLLQAPPNACMGTALNR
jgi:hypothetical protein